MDMTTMLLVSTVALVICVGLIIALAVAWLRAEAKICRLGGQSKWIKGKRKGGKGKN